MAVAPGSPETRSRTSTSPTAASSAPPIVATVGFWPCRSQNQSTTAAGAVYSMSRAGPIGMSCTAEK